MKKTVFIALLILTAIGLHKVTTAQTISTLSPFRVSGTVITPTLSTNSFQIPALATTTPSLCVTTNASGTFSLTACSAGSTPTTTINDVSGPTFTLVASGPGLTISTSTGTITLTYSSSSLNLGSASLYAYGDFLASSTTYVANTNGNWAGTWQLYAPTDFLSSSTAYIATNTGDWDGTWKTFATTDFLSSSTAYIATNTGNWAGTWQSYNYTDFLSSSTVYISTSTGLTTANFASANVSQWTNNSGYITTSTGLGVANFASANVSQWTNDAGYVTSTAGGTPAGTTQDIQFAEGTAFSADLTGKLKYTSSTNQLKIGTSTDFSTDAYNSTYTYKLAVAGPILFGGGTPTIGFSTSSEAVQESQTGILYTGAASQATSSQPLGTGYAMTATKVETVLYTGDASTVFYLQECSSSAYSDCVDKASTTAINTSAADGNTYIGGNFATSYPMTASNYYRLWTTYGSNNGRAQCGNTSAMTPIVGSDGGDCGGASRAQVFKLYGTTAIGGHTVAGSNAAGMITPTSTTGTFVVVWANGGWTNPPVCTATPSKFAIMWISANSATSTTFNSSTTLTTSDKFYYNCSGR